MGCCGGLSDQSLAVMAGDVGLDHLARLAGMERGERETFRAADYDELVDCPMEIGTHHHIAGPYLYSYAGEAAWREDNRRVDNGSQAMTLTAAAMGSRVSRLWKGYWQRVA